MSSALKENMNTCTVQVAELFDKCDAKLRSAEFQKF